MSEIEKYYNGEIHVDFDEKTIENDFDKAVEFMVESDFNKDLNKCLDIVKELDKKDKEIENQKEVINGMIENEEKYNLEINKLKSIIKEVRELIKELMKYYNGEIGEKTDYLNIHIGMINELLEILDKENNNE